MNMSTPYDIRCTVCQFLCPCIQLAKAALRVVVKRGSSYCKANVRSQDINYPSPFSL